MPIEFDKRAALRFGAGVSSAFVVSQILAWPLCFIMPIFVAMFLQAPAQVPLNVVYRLILKTAGILALGLFISLVFLPYPLVFSVITVSGLFLIFRLGATGSSPLLVVIALIAILLIPVLVLGDSDVAASVTMWLLIDFILGISVAGFFFYLIPVERRPDAPAATPAPLPENEVIARSFRMTLVVAPLALGFLMFGWSSVLTLIMAAILAQQLSAATGLQSGLALLVANMAGALVAWLVYNILVAAPSMPLMAGLTAFVAFATGVCFFSNIKALKLAGSANNAYLVLLGGSLAPFSDDVETKITQRIYLIALAVAYVVIVFQVIEGLRTRKKELEHDVQEV
ncbi:MAG: DUF2955 domain-containing protein [Hyphomicrobiales bacterium]